MCIVYDVHSHTQRARLQTCIAVTKNTQIDESARGYIGYVAHMPTLADLPYKHHGLLSKAKI